MNQYVVRSLSEMGQVIGHSRVLPKMSFQHFQVVVQDARKFRHRVSTSDFFGVLRTEALPACRQWISGFWQQAVSHGVVNQIGATEQVHTLRKSQNINHSPWCSSAEKKHHLAEDLCIN